MYVSYYHVHWWIGCSLSSLFMKYTTKFRKGSIRENVLKEQRYWVQTGWDRFPAEEDMTNIFPKILLHRKLASWINDLPVTFSIPITILFKSSIARGQLCGLLQIKWIMGPKNMISLTTGNCSVILFIKV